MLEKLNMVEEIDNLTLVPVCAGNVVYLPQSDKPSGLTIRNIPEIIINLFLLPTRAGRTT